MSTLLIVELDIYKESAYARVEEYLDLEMSHKDREDKRLDLELLEKIEYIAL